MQLMQDHRVKVLYHNGQTENIEMSIWPRGQLEIPSNNKSISFLSAYFKAPENLERTKQKMNVVQNETELTKNKP